MVELRVLTPDDWPLWRELRLAALADAPDAFGSTLAEWRDADEDRWRARLSIPGARDLVAVLDDQAGGMVSGVRGDLPDSVGLISMWVDPTARGRGVGDRLVEAVARWGADQGAATLRLSVGPGNDWAVALYVRHGFRDTGEGALRPDGVTRERILAKDLAGHRGAELC